MAADYITGPRYSDETTACGQVERLSSAIVGLLRFSCRLQW